MVIAGSICTLKRWVLNFECSPVSPRSESKNNSVFLSTLGELQASFPGEMCLMIFQRKWEKHLNWAEDRSVYSEPVSVVLQSLIAQRYFVKYCVAFGRVTQDIGDGNSSCCKTDDKVIEWSPVG